MAMTTATDDAVQMLQNGWTVRYKEDTDDIEWRSPEGISGCDYHSDSLDSPPPVAVDRALSNGQIIPRPRVASGG